MSFFSVVTFLSGNKKRVSKVPFCASWTFSLVACILCCLLRATHKKLQSFQERRPIKAKYTFFYKKVVYTTKEGRYNDIYTVLTTFKQAHHLFHSIRVF